MGTVLEFLGFCVVLAGLYFGWQLLTGRIKISTEFRHVSAADLERLKTCTQEEYDHFIHHGHFPEPTPPVEEKKE